MALEYWLDSKCKREICRNPNCEDAIKQAPSGKWYITMGHAGFNSKANNFDGYTTKNKAYAAMMYYLNKSYYKK